MIHFLIVAIWFNSQSVGYWPMDEEPHPIIMKCNGRYGLHDLYEGCNG
jgi:hypothetical protein